MSRGRGDGELRLKGAGLKRSFVLSMTLSLGLVMIAASAVIYFGTQRVQENLRTDEITQAVRLTHRGPRHETVGDGKRYPNDVEVYDVEYGPDRRSGTLYRYEGGSDETRGEFRLIVPPAQRGKSKALLGIIAATMIVVVVVGALVALWVAGKVTRPVQMLIDDVRQISHGELQRRIHVSGAGEIELLARSIQRMTSDLEEAQEAQFELSVRERELSLAGDVREALLPVTTPLIDGYDIGAVHMSSPNIGGDFHDYIEMEDGRVGLLVCDVSGTGMPAALIGATARSYLRSELMHLAPDAGPAEVAAAMRRVNQWLVADVRRGVYVTALYALVDPARGRASVACAGHKIPLLRYAAEDGTMRTVHPDGIALGLDRGAVFERRLEVAEVPLESGDRFFLCNSGPVRIVNAEGREIGEKALFARVLKYADLESLDFLKALRADISAFAGDEGVPHDISLVTISRSG
ncbi:MAG: SpoIIE family protein phosphatase [Planctomycetota bacterium]